MRERYSEEAVKAALESIGMKPKGESEIVRRRGLYRSVMPVIYVAGPFRAGTLWEIEKNIRTAESWSYLLWKLGASVICPHANSRHFHGSFDDQVFLDGTMEMLIRSDGVFMLPAWVASEGARSENHEALERGLPVFYATEGGLKHVKLWVETYRARIGQSR